MSVAPGVYDSVGNFKNSVDMQIEAVYVRDWNGPLNIDGAGTSLTAGMCKYSDPKPHSAGHHLPGS